MNRPTLHDVAREAGVSHMTVSRVVRGDRPVREETARRVRAAVIKLDYRPDPALSALAAYRSRDGGRGAGGILACIDCDDSLYSRDVFAGVRAEAALFGYACELIPLPSGTTRQRQLGRTLYHRGVRGLLFGPSRKREEFTGWDWPNFATVSLGALGHRPAMHAVSLDYFHGAISACEHLRETGARRIALLLDPQLGSRTGGLWIGGYLAGVIAHHTPLIADPETLSRPPQLRDWLTRQKIDAVLTIHPGIAPLLRELVLAARYLNQDGAGLAFPHYHLPHPDIGREGVRLLHHALLRHEFGLPAEPKRVALRGTWLEPTTTA